MTDSSLPTSCDVALPIPAREPYRYHVPSALADRIAPGSRVVVPVRAREVVGVVTSLGDAANGELKSVILAPDATPLIPAPLLSLARWISHYYAAPIGLTLKAMLPGALWGSSRMVASLRDANCAAGGASRAVVDALEKRGGRATASTLRRAVGRPVWNTLQRLAKSGAVILETEPPRLGPSAGSEAIVKLTRVFPSLLEREEFFGRARRQREAYETIDALEGEVTVRRVTSEFGFSRNVIRALVDRGAAAFEERTRLRDPFSSVTAASPADPTHAQRRAIDAIQALPAGAAATLFGVTGSGKTLVYLRAIQQDIQRGRGAIVLVPEIALTPQTIARVRGVFGDAVAVLHSGLSDGERADAWRALASGRKQVAVGARSAIFAPVRDLAAIIVDEEHDASYKNGELPRYHARDVARRRARLERATVIYGSATPSLETWSSSSNTVIALPDRVTAQPLPTVQTIDLRSADQVDGCGRVPWTVALDAAVGLRLRRREQTILLLNRRGFAHFLQCGECGEVTQCASCSIALTVHRTPPSLRCHYCGHERKIPAECANCGGAVQRTRGVGTQSLEEWLSRRFSDARLARMDADTVGTKWSHHRILDAFSRGDIDVLLGTQMIAKGLDFPGVTLVGVVNADTGLHLADFRSAERTFQLVAQVAGRAGRGPQGGEVIVQTRMPHHYALQAAAAHDFVGFAQRELAERESPAYPPHVALANVVISGEQEMAVSRAADEVASWLRGLLETKRLSAEVLGPAPAPLVRIKRRWRWHVMLRAPDAGDLGRIVRFASERAPHARSGKIRVIFDRDPVSLL